MKPTIRERLIAINIRLQVRLGLLTYGRQKDGSVGGVTVPIGFNTTGRTEAKIYNASKDEWRNFGVIASPKPSIFKRLLYAHRIRKANQWLRS